jgi:cellulose 1,4-beta-cellobiosidase
MAPGSTTEYQIFQPNNKEFTMDVDVSQLPCGLNGAVYFTEMDADGGMARFPANKAGANYGTGYCDSQCPMDLKFINGQANILNWTATDANSGNGKYGSCCNEMDIWEANSISSAYTAHPCSVAGQTECSGSQCSIIDRYGGLCDPDGCDFNSYRMGDSSFYGPGKTIDTTKVITVVTQFITSDGTDTGTLSAIKRIYVQNGIVYQNSLTNVVGITPVDDITDAMCTQAKAAFNNTNSFGTNGGLTALSSAFEQGIVLVLSIWDDYAADMLWLDSDYPTTANPATPGVARGTCAITSGVPATVEQSPAQVIFSNLKFGPINSTYSGTPYGGGGTTTTTATTTTTSLQTSSSSTTQTTTTTAVGAQQTHYGQCGGIGYTGPTVCAPYTCTYSNPYYSQCL